MHASFCNENRPESLVDAQSTPITSIKEAIDYRAPARHIGFAISFSL